MVKLRVSDLAKKRNVSVQTIYKQIKKGLLTITKEEGITYVITDNEEFEEKVKHDVKQSLNSDCKEVLKMVKTLQKEVKRLTKELIKCNASKESVLISYIEELKALRLPTPETIVNIEPIPTTKKKKKKKKKKK